MQDLAKRDCELEADLLVHLGEVDARELHLTQSYSSMFSYCTEALHFSESVAYHRITAARAARAYPLLLERLRSGELHLAGIRLLAPHLTQENHVELIDQARHRTKRAIEELLADRAPKPEVPPLVRLQVALPSTASSSEPEIPPAAAMPRCPAPTEAHASASVAAPASAHPKPLGAQRYHVGFTANAETRAKLREAQALLRHQIPDGDLGKVFDRALTALLREVRRTRFAETDRPRESASPEPATSPASRHIPAAVRREVAQRDEGRCTFVAANGRRCNSRDAVEFHHLAPFAKTPQHSVAGITLRCRAHNRHAAVGVYGAEYMAQFRNHFGDTPATRPGASSPESAFPDEVRLCRPTAVRRL